MRAIVKPLVGAREWRQHCHISGEENEHSSKNLVYGHLMEKGHSATFDEHAALPYRWWGKGACTQHSGTLDRWGPLLIKKRFKHPILWRTHTSFIFHQKMSVHWKLWCIFDERAALLEWGRRGSEARHWGTDAVMCKADCHKKLLP